MKNQISPIPPSRFKPSKLGSSKEAFWKREEAGPETDLQVSVVVLCGFPRASCVTLCKSPSPSGPACDQGD